MKSRLAAREAQRLMQAGRWQEALREIDRALPAQPREAALLIGKAQCLVALGRRGEAHLAATTAASVATAAGATGRAGPGAAAFDAVGSVFSFAGDQPKALDAYDQAVALAPENPAFLYNRATVLRFLGRLREAEADYDRVIALRPGDFEAYKNRSDLRVQTPAANHVAELERLAAAGIADWRGEVQVRFALAKEYEDLGEYARSFEVLQAGARRRREHMRYDVTTDLATVNWIIDAFPAAPAPVAGPPSESPIFIVGLPRSGTTLVDRILSSHSSIEPAGELNDFALALMEAVRRTSGGVQLPRRELVQRSAQLDFAALGEDYLRRARVVAGNGRFTDKMPLNYLYCGLILRALPGAKIVHLTRHPMAVCYAMYKTLFKQGYPFSYDLEEIAAYYAAYRRLMDHWELSMPGSIFSLGYEELVADQTAATARLLTFCGLGWEDACLDFHRNPTASTTASAAQIRRPLYDTSVSQWRHYAEQLKTLARALEAAGVDSRTNEVS